MESLLAILPWALFGVMVLFGIIFAIVAWSATRRAAAAEERAEQASGAYGYVEARARSAEQQIAVAEQRATLAEQRIAHAEDRMQKARDVAKAAEQRAAEAEQRAADALREAQRADSELRERRDAASDRARQAETRARALLDWAKGQWEARREPDRQQAQAVQGPFQAQLDAYLAYRAAPIVFRVDGDVDRLAGPLIERYAAPGQHVALDGDVVRVTFPVDPSLGFRA
ncbi:MAG: hypothetical protein KF729_18230 [Sandaracinaceae bacterium]|nr:hypothetical protein [Sandaracinaceae bacterium]